MFQQEKKITNHHGNTVYLWANMRGKLPPCFTQHLRELFVTAMKQTNKQMYNYACTPPIYPLTPATRLATVLEVS